MALLRHVGIAVSDMERAISFYRDLLGFAVRKEMNESGSYIDNFCCLKEVAVKTVKMADDNGNLIELLHFSSHFRDNLKNFQRELIDVGISHFALTVDDIEETYEKLKEKGVMFNCVPQNTPDGYAKVAFCRDLDGNFIELVEVLDG